VIERREGLLAWGEALGSLTDPMLLGAIDVVTVEGPEASSFLQGQLAQDVETLAPGASRWSLLLEPDGMLGHLVRVVRESDEHVALVGARGDGDAIAARLARFKLRVQAAIEVVDRLLVIGPPPEGSLELVSTARSPRQSLAARSERELEGATDQVAMLEAWTLVTSELSSADVREGMNPFELGADVVDGAVSQTKGCYTGQELVARVMARAGSAPQRLCLIEAVGQLDGSTVSMDGVDVGDIVRGVFDPQVDRSWAVARVARKAVPSGEAVCRVGGLDGVLRSL
jgi:folate-binding protein YgfZ